MNRDEKIRCGNKIEVDEVVKEMQDFLLVLAFVLNGFFEFTVKMIKC